jgi:hypothetical protein
MRDFTLPFKPEELLAQPADGRLWAEDIPNVENWSSEESAGNLDGLIGRLLTSNGYDLAETASFSMMFALIQAWPRLEDDVRARVPDILTDAARRVIVEVTRLKKDGVARKAPTARVSKKKGEDDGQEDVNTLKSDARNASKIVAFFLRWCLEKVVRGIPGDSARRGRGRAKGAKKDGDAAKEEQDLKQAQLTLEKHRVALLTEVANLISTGAMPWLWMGDDNSWQQAAQCVSDAGFAVVDSEQAVKHKETRAGALRCIAGPLLQAGHQHGNLLLTTVSKLTHTLRGHELAAAFAADTLLVAHSTPLPRSFLVELTQHCTPAELQSQGAFQRSMGSFLSAAAERLPHVVLGNISVLLPLLDVDVYPLRSAVVESIGHLLASEGKALPQGAHCGGAEGAAAAAGSEAAAPAEVANAESAETALVSVKDLDIPGAPGAKDSDVERFSIAEATKKHLLETLAMRATDKTVWVRVRTLQTFNNLAGRKKRGSATARAVVACFGDCDDAHAGCR